MDKERSQGEKLRRTTSTASGSYNVELYEKHAVPIKQGNPSWSEQYGVLGSLASLSDLDSDNIPNRQK